MIDPELAMAQLKSLNLFRVVGGAAELAELKQPGKALGDGPNAYVVPLSDEPQPPRSEGGPQPMVTSFGVVIMVRRHGDALGQKTMNALRPLRVQLLSGLLGWSPSTGFGKLFYRGGHLSDFTTAALWWQDDYACHCGIAPTNQL
jgi:hypothetical protein